MQILQRRHIRLSTVIISKMRAQFKPAFEFFTDYCHEAMLHHADPHPKRELRINAYTEIVERALDYSTNHPWVFLAAHWKLKPAEWKKPGKYGRTIVDVKTPASLLGFILCDVIKVAMASTVIEYKGGHIAFCKSPATTALRLHFRNLISPPGRFYYVYFSDDSCCAMRVPNAVHWYNLDITACDASHTEELFFLLRKLLPKRVRPAMTQLINQCKSPLKLKSCVNPKISCVLKPRKAMLYSGVTPTGAINGVASTLIACAIADCRYVDGSDLRDAAREAGYVISGWEKPLVIPEHIQFLKHSPVLDLAGEWQPCPNLGILLRASGACKGDLAGRGPIEPRARAFQYGLIHGCYPRIQMPLLDAMRDATTLHHLNQVPKPILHQISQELLFKSEFDDDTVLHLDQNSALRRYDFTTSETVDFLHYCTQPLGVWTNCTAVSKVLNLDYGLSCIERESPLWACQAKYAIVPP